jgi:ligand-binding SRPBCC domain-containing protein
MTVIRKTTVIQAPVERCFDLARSVDVHVTSTSFSGERAVGGVTAGLMKLGDEVTWRARHLGMVQHLSSRITAFDPPRYFRDSMLRGVFSRIDHDHFFEAAPDGATIMTDVFDFQAPLGFLGRLAEHVFLAKYMDRLLSVRNEAIKRLAESEEWRRYLPGP